MEWSPFAWKFLFASGFSLFHFLISTTFTSQSYNVCDEILYSDISTYRRGHGHDYGHNDVYYHDQTLLHDIHKSTLPADFDFDFDFQNTFSIPPLLFFKAGQPSTYYMDEYA